jgi:L-aminopeptidase/D-esterase-like protein
MNLRNSITDVPGVKVGHAQDDQALTGCTVVLCEKGATCGVDQRGGAPGTRETDALRPMHLVEQVHAVLLAGGAAFGLDAASGVVRFLEEKGLGFDTGVARVPVVPAAILFDLGIGRSDVRPDAAMGYQACQAASSEPPQEGNAGAGSGATVGKILGMGQAVKSGIGSASIDIGGGIVVGALVAVNALGDVLDPQNGQIIAGARPLPDASGKASGFADTLEVMKQFTTMTGGGFPNTVIGVVAVNAHLSKEKANLIARMAHNGIARTVRPASTLWDGDTVFALAAGERQIDASLAGAFAAEAMAQAVVRAVRAARSAGGIPSMTEWLGGG